MTERQTERTRLDAPKAEAFAYTKVNKGAKDLRNRTRI